MLSKDLQTSSRGIRFCALDSAIRIWASKRKHDEEFEAMANLARIKRMFVVIGVSNRRNRYRKCSSKIKGGKIFEQLLDLRLLCCCLFVFSRTSDYGYR